MGRGAMAAIGVLAAAVTSVPFGEEVLAQRTCRSGGIQSESFAYGLLKRLPDLPIDRRDAVCYLIGHRWATRAE